MREMASSSTRGSDVSSQRQSTQPLSGAKPSGVGGTAVPMHTKVFEKLRTLVTAEHVHSVNGIYDIKVAPPQPGETGDTWRLDLATGEGDVFVKKRSQHHAIA
eukprot:m.352979 g.352979  ORF g.352979 m.352979 type:complete len:103 (+) comp16587_c0_seq1:268-576(+)